MVVDIVNRVPGQGFGIHWRGQPQKETPVMDGVPMVTQCPIASSTTFQYKFRASQPGTHMWHANTGTRTHFNDSFRLQKKLQCHLKNCLY
jgi:FtsP/CotA-like multicopper oxidase with cupredoxin domain